MLSFEEALEQVLANINQTDVVETPIERCLGTYLAEDLVSPINQPPEAVSAMDGYAVKAKDTDSNLLLEQVGESAAGHPYSDKITDGQCVRIFTGAVVPSGADAILIQEDAEVVTEFGTVKIKPTDSVEPKQFVRSKGLDFSVGHTIPSGTKFSSRSLSLAAAMNSASVKIHRQPRVAIISTGDEIQLPGSALSKGQIVSSNHIALSSLISIAGGEPTFLGIAKDGLNATERLIEISKGFDLLLTTGGASVGDHDFMKEALLNKGAKLDFWKIAMKPGKPMIFGQLDHMPILGLPGNPVSAYITALLFAFPAIKKMRGATDLALNTTTACLSEDLQSNGPRREFRRVKLQHVDNKLWCTAYNNQDSSMLSRLSEADGLISVPPHAATIAQGKEVEILLLPD